MAWENSSAAVAVAHLGPIVWSFLDKIAVFDATLEDQKSLRHFYQILHLRHPEKFFDFSLQDIFGGETFHPLEGLDFELAVVGDQALRHIFVDDFLFFFLDI